MNRQLDVKALVSHIVRGDGFDKCRICMGDTNHGQVQLGDTMMMDGEKPVSLSDLLKVITGVEIESSGLLPMHICQTCCSSIMNFLPFFQLCRESVYKWNQIAEHFETMSVHERTKMAYVVVNEEVTTVTDRTSEKKAPQNVIKNLKHRLSQRKYEKTSKSRHVKLTRKKQRLNNFTCPECDVTFNRLHRFNGHIINLGKRCCEYCYSIVDLKLLRAHLQIHNIDAFSCNICSLHFISPGQLNKHKKTHERGSFICPECQETFGTSDRLSIHFSSRHEMQKCSCGRVLTKRCYKSHIKSHLNCQEKLNRKYICDYCSKEFKTKPPLTGHIHFYHYKVRVCQCDVCGKQFRNQISLTEHRNCHEKVLDRYSCEFCGKNFSTSKGHKKHMNNKHYKDNPELFTKVLYQCHVCDKILISELNLRKHLRNKHNVV